MPVLRYITRAGGILSMMSEKVYIIDNIPLFNPVTAGGKTLSYDEFMAGRTTLGLCTKIYFVTSDIDSITNMTMKMQNIFIQSRMPVIVLKDTKREKNITVWHLLLRLVKKRQEELYAHVYKNNYGIRCTVRRDGGSFYGSDKRIGKAIWADPSIYDRLHFQ